MGVVRFLMDGAVVEVKDPKPTLTVLNWLRYEARRTGTKEGCAEGDCGACTVLLGELESEKVQWRAVNACILFLPRLHGRALMTVESLGGEHPVQQAMVERHGSQCGFCTPGIVMSLAAMSSGATDEAINDTLAGNLCRCTGYGPIIGAAKAASLTATPLPDVAAGLRALRADGPLESQGFFAPTTLAELTRLVERHPKATILAGGTDVGLWVTKQHRALPTIISINDVEEMKRIIETDGALEIGAAVRYAEAIDRLASLYPDFGEVLRRLGSVQVRNMGTLGGNIANGSPIGDAPPALIALGATLVLRSAAGPRALPLEDYFLAYGLQDRQPAEVVEKIIVPKPRDGAVFKMFKISKRFDQDISAVCAAFNLLIQDGVVVNARIAFGGMAATPKRALACEDALVGQSWTEATVNGAMAALDGDFSPIDDMRASSLYRTTVAKNLLRKVWIETATPGARTRVLTEKPVHA